MTATEPNAPTSSSPSFARAFLSAVRRFTYLRFRAIIIATLGFLIMAQFHFYGQIDVRQIVQSASPATHRRVPGRHKHVAQSHLTHASDGGRVVVTGGGGNIGKEIVRKLLNQSTPVTVLDKIFHQDELDEILTDIPSARTLLRVKLGDIRDADALEEVMTKDVVGVVHLAAVSRVLWCLNNEPDCMDVNERGTDMVLTALSDLNHKDDGRRWFLLASSREVYGDAKVSPVLEDSETSPVNVYGTSKLKAEQVVRKHVESASSLHAIALRLSNVYGGVYDHVERLIPSIATQSLSHQVVQIVGGKQNFDLLHIDDCVDAFLLAIHHLSRTSPLSPSSFDAYNVASGFMAPVDKLVDMVVRLTRSKSPIQYIPGDDRFPNTYIGSTERAWEVLGFQAAVTVEEGVLRFIRAYLEKTERFLNKQIASHCTNPNKVAPEDLIKLTNCQSHLTVDIQGELATVVDWDADNSWHASREMPIQTLRTFVKYHDGKPLMSFKSKDMDGWLGFRDNATAGTVELRRMWKTDIDAGAMVDWEVRVNPKNYLTVKLVAVGTELQLVGPPSTSGKFSLIDEWVDVWPFRVTPVCCSAPPPWPFFTDDANDYMVGYQRTAVDRPFLASPDKALCNRYTRARARVGRDLATLSLDALEPMRRPLAAAASKWANANLASCSNNCDAPTICIDTGDCQCVLSSCVPKRRFPFHSSANLPRLSFPPRNYTIQEGSNPLIEVVERSSWLNVLRPQAARFIGTGISFPKLHVGALAPKDAEWRSMQSGKDAHKLKDSHCFSADTSMESAAALMGVTADDAEVVFVPHFQGRAEFDDRLYRTYDYISTNVPNFDPNRVVIPFTHDWGLCLTFDWNVWLVRQKKGLEVNHYVRSSIAWTVMADLNSPCYRPHQDVVIPPRTCISPKLFAAFDDMSTIRPARDRNVLATFKGTPWGTGSITRQKLMCPRLDAQQIATLPERKLISPQSLSTMWDTTGDYSYTALLNDTIFCPQPAGTTGWATRLVDSLYAGCIPVLIGQSAQYPFFDVIDWGKISVRVEANEVNRLEEILLSRYTMEDIERLQANIMLVRDAFVYPLDDADASTVQNMMLDRRGPLFYALHSTKMRMLTRYPEDTAHDRP